MESGEFVEQSNFFSRVNAARVRATDVSLCAQWLREELRHYGRITELFNQIREFRTGEDGEERVHYPEYESHKLEIRNLRKTIETINFDAAASVDDLKSLLDRESKSENTVNDAALTGLALIEQKLLVCVKQLVSNSVFLPKHTDTLRCALQKYFCEVNSADSNSR